MNMMLTEEELIQLLGEAADSYAAPEQGPEFVIEQLAARKGPSRKVLRISGAAAALVAGVFVVQGVGFGGGASRVATVPAALATSAPLASGRGGTTGATTGTTGGSTGGATSGASGVFSSAPVLAPAAAPEAAQVPVPTSASKSTAGLPLAPTVTDTFSDGARIVKRGSINLVVAHGKVDAVASQVGDIALAANGYASGESSTEIGDNPRASMTVRVPVKQFESVETRIRATVRGGVGKVESTSSSGTDVTAQYSDVSAQIQSLKASRERFLTILGRANTIGETLEVQQRVDDVQEQIDRLTGQQKLLANQSSLATLTITISEKATAAIAKKPTVSGLTRSWRLAKHGFSTTIESLIARSGKGLVVLIIAALGLVILRSGWRLARRRMV